MKMYCFLHTPPLCACTRVMTLLALHSYRLKLSFVLPFDFAMSCAIDIMPVAFDSHCQDGSFINSAHKNIAMCKYCVFSQ